MSTGIIFGAKELISQADTCLVEAQTRWELGRTEAKVTSPMPPSLGEGVELYLRLKGHGCSPSGRSATATLSFADGIKPQDGDGIGLDADAGRPHLGIFENVPAQRSGDWSPWTVGPASGNEKLFHDHVREIGTRANFDFFRGCRGNPFAKASH